MHQTQQEIAKEQLVIEAAKTNPAAFGPLYEKYYKSIFLFIYRRTDDEQLTADLCSQVFMKAMTSIKGYAFRGLPFSAWLYRVAVNEINQFYRKYQASRFINVDDEGLMRLSESLTDEDEELGEKEIEENRMLDALNHLTGDEVQFIEMRFFEGRAFRDIGLFLNITENNAKVKTYRILDKLKKLLNQKDS